jgi:tetratricopeptide (TPR) repeat protein
MRRKLLAFLVLSAVLTPFLGAGLEEAWQIYFAQADQALLSSKYQEAIGYYLKGIFFAPPSEIPKTWDDLGYAYLQMRSLKDAVEYCQRALAWHPDNYDLHLYLALAYLLSDDLKRTDQELKCIEQKIYFTEGWVEKALGFKPKNKQGEEVSREQLERLKKEKGIGLFPDTSSSVTVNLDAFDERNEGVFYFIRGLVDAQTGDRKQAQEMFRAAVEAGYDPEAVRLGQTHPPREIPLRIFHRIWEHNNRLALTLHEKFVKQVEGGHIEKAIQTLQEALEVYEQSFELNYNLAMLSYDVHNLDQAEISCARALWFKESDPAAHELMGNIYFNHKAYDRALLEFRRVIEIDERNAAGHFNLGSAYYQLGDSVLAETHWKKAVACDPAGMNEDKAQPGAELHYSSLVKKTPIAHKAHLALGNLYSERGRPEMAITEFEASARLKPEDPEPYWHLGKLYLEQKETDKALACLKKYLYLGGKNEHEANQLLDSIKKK